jgi:hypothetical protein
MRETAVPTSQSRWGRWPLYASLFLLSLFVLPGQLRPAQFFHDDAYFYLQVAHNLASGFGSTFHQITETNGYHPLWMLFCALGMLTAGLDKILALNVIGAFQVGLFVLLALAFRRLASHSGSPFLAPGLALLASYFFSTALYGSEAYLNGMLLAASMLALLEASERVRIGWWCVSGALLGLAVLARLDNVFPAATLAASALLLAPRRGARLPWRRTLALSLPLIAVVAPYLALNQLLFGHVVPISGAIKSTFPNPTPSLAALGPLGKITTLAAIVSTLASVAPGWKRSERLLLVGLGSGVLLHALYICLFTDHYTFWRWYYVAGVLNLALFLCLLLGWAERQPPPSRIATLVPVASAGLAFVLATGGLAYGWLKAFGPERIGPLEVPLRINQYRWPEELARWLKAEMPRGAGLLAYDYPGALAYHSDLRVLPVDGLVNDFDYSDEIVRVGIGEYLCRHDIGLYFGALLAEDATEQTFGPRGELTARRLADDTQAVEVLAPLGHASAGSFEIRDKAILGRLREIVAKPEEAPPLAIWKLDLACDRAAETAGANESLFDTRR